MPEYPLVEQSSEKLQRVTRYLNLETVWIFLSQDGTPLLKSEDHADILMQASQSNLTNYQRLMQCASGSCLFPPPEHVW
jgi:hypothetical protein